MKSLDIVHEVEQYCKSLLASSRCRELPFHNWQHTLDVVANSQLIGQRENLTAAAMEELTIAAFFHDTGNAKQAAGHELLSCKFAREFLTAQEYPDERINSILNLIESTQMPQQPVSTSEKIICDADLAHLGKSNFLDKNAKLRKEWEIYNNLKYSNEEWLCSNIRFLQMHKFHTTTAQVLYVKQKAKNIEMLELAFQSITA